MPACVSHMLMVLSQSQCMLLTACPALHALESNTRYFPLPGHCCCQQQCSAQAPDALPVALPPQSPSLLPPCCTYAQAAYPYVAQIYSQALPTLLTLFLMTVASTWLLMHAASQWGRTRSEAKLLERIPHAAKHALSACNQQQQQGGGGFGGSPAAGGLAGKGVSSDGGMSNGGGLFKGGGLVKGEQQGFGGGAGSRGVSSTGEPSAPLEGPDVPHKGPHHALNSV
jgi:hypothetical protein